MSEQTNALPHHWKEYAAETVRALSVARHLASRHATDETPESVLLPALLLSVTITRTGAEICNRIEGVYDAIGCLSQPRLTETIAEIAEEIRNASKELCRERLAGIERELSRIGNTIGDR